MFVDRVKLAVQAGRGGAGCLSFRREKYVPLGGPDGGDGGHGGSVIVVAEAGVDSLAAVSHRGHWKAASGKSGSGYNCQGASADDVTIPVPPGTMIIDPASGVVIRDLTSPGDKFFAARGGRGGRGNASFKSSTNRAPRDTTPGEEGESRELILELKCIADVGLIGKPNAGKSTLLSRLSRARPEIAAYPFTTKYPNLGMVRVDRDHAFVLADIPGLIEGAHAGVGLGHEFLRHVERAGILVHLVEPAPADGADPIENYRVIREELRLYRQDLADRTEIVAMTKCELPGAAEAALGLSQAIGRDVLVISAVTGQGLDHLLRAIGRELDARPKGLARARLEEIPRESSPTSTAPFSDPRSIE